MDYYCKDRPGDRRDMSNPDHLNTRYDQEASKGHYGAHWGGEFFSAILWDIRQQMAYPANLDKIVYNTLFRIDDTPTYQSFRDKMLAASQELYNGEFNTLIANAFFNRGVGVPSNTITINANVSGPANLSYMQTGIFVCTPTNGTAPYTYNWYIKTVCDGGGLDELAPCSYWTPIGTNNDSLTIGYQTSFLLRADLIDLNGNTGSSSVWTVTVSGNSAPKVTYTSEMNVIPDKFELHQNYPNPFNPTTIFKYGLPKDAHVTIKIYNTLGAEVVTLVNEEKPAGFHEITFDGSRFASGMYFYRMTAGEFTETKKLILVK